MAERVEYPVSNHAYRMVSSIEFPLATCISNEYHKIFLTAISNGATVEAEEVNTLGWVKA